MAARKKTMRLAVQQISDAVSLMHNSRQMMIATLPKRLGFFTRLLDQADPTERYRLATAQIIHAERFGFDSAWIAQHHFHEDEGGLPAPFVFLAQVAAQTTRIRLGTAIVTLPLELPIRVAEDSAVLDLMCGGRLEVGVGGGGNLSSYAAFRQNSAERATLLAGHLQVLRDRKSTRLNSSHGYISYAVFCLKKKQEDNKSETSNQFKESKRLAQCVSSDTYSNATSA